jgi:hypothetical protein
MTHLRSDQPLAAEKRAALEARGAHVMALVQP